MTEINDGEVVVIRDGEFVEAVFYRKFYFTLDEFIDEVKQYLSVKEFENPNISFMEMKEGRLKIIESETAFKKEFERFISNFNSNVINLCDCGTLNFVYLSSPQTYCPKCEKIR